MYPKRNRRPACWLLALALVPAAAAGCRPLYFYRPVDVLVRDAETKAPISKAQVQLSYPLTRTSAAPANSSGAAGEDGVAHLRATPHGDFGVQFEATATGYQAETLDVTASGIAAIEPPPLFAAAKPRPADFVVEMYAEPRFAVELVVPTGYRGLLKAELRVRPDAPREAGRRCFSYVVSPAGNVRVEGSALLRRVAPPDYLARYADGTKLGEDRDPTHVRCRYFRRELDDLYFIVGTLYECDQYRRIFAPSGPRLHERAEDGDPNGHRGGRRRRNDSANSQG